jgi:hypothetical protein
MGAAAGAGGIGFNLFMSSAYFFDMREIGYITYLILFVAIINGNICHQIKKEIYYRYRINNAKGWEIPWHFILPKELIWIQ